MSLLLREEAAVISDKAGGGGLVCQKCPFMCVSTEFDGTLLHLFPNKINTQTDYSGTGWVRAFWEGSEGLLTCARVLLEQCWSYRLNFGVGYLYNRAVETLLGSSVAFLPLRGTYIASRNMVRSI